MAVETSLAVSSAHRLLRKRLSSSACGQTLGSSQSSLQLLCSGSFDESQKLNLNVKMDVAG